MKTATINPRIDPNLKEAARIAAQLEQWQPDQKGLVF